MKKGISLILSAALFAGALTPLPARAAAVASAAGMVDLSYGNLNIRNARSTTAQIVATVPDGSYITLISSSGAWWYVEYADGKYGYCHADYITRVSTNTATVNVSYGSLNVRSGAGASYARIGSLSKGETVIVLSASGGWSRVLYDGVKTGYVSTAYLSTSGGYSSVSLSVPSFKQTDSRWASMTVGSSGKTMAKIGCATVAIAMMESHRTGQTIYPSTMTKRLSYTPSGNVYWPSNFIAVTNSSNYLSAIYQRLKEGKPVLFGAKNPSGSQHWVVIRGFTGGTLSAKNFIINDPGSSTRTTLAQFLSAYPTFYKYFYCS